jgi:DNA (cytosine-5)-methyltransferase 1
MKHLSLFSGIGGIDLAAQWAGITTVAFCEKDGYCRKVLAKHWPDVYQFEDVRDITSDSIKPLGAINIVTGGFPCQPFSNAGKRRGAKDDRYLWPEMSRVIEITKPAWIVAENVPGIISLAIDDVLSDLEDKGYEAWPIVFPACAVDAPHIRARVFIVAHSNCIDGRSPRPGEMESQSTVTAIDAGEQPSSVADAQCTRPQRNARGGHNQAGRENEQPALSGDDVPDSNGGRRKGESKCNRNQEQDSPIGNSCGYDVDGHDRADSDSIRCDRWFLPAETTQAPGWDATERNHAWTVEPGVGRVADGVPHRVDRLRALGNAVVPQQVYPLLRWISELEVETNA